MQDSDSNWLLNNLVHLVLATADADGKPWISPVFFARDDHNNLYWVSDRNSRHSRNIRQRAEVAVVIFGRLPSGEIEALYIDASAKELVDPNEIELGMKVLQKRQQARRFTVYEVTDVTGEACWRMYKTIPKSMSKRADGVDKRTGQAITIREPVQF